MRKSSLLLASLLVVSAGQAAYAEEKLTTEQAGTRDIVFDLGVGARVQPKFASSDDYIVLPYPLFAVSYLRLPVFGEVVSAPTRAFSLYPSINFVGSRDSDDASYLRGMNDVDFAFELGPGIAYRYGMVRGFVEARYGITGHNGVRRRGGPRSRPEPVRPHPGFRRSAGRLRQRRVRRDLLRRQQRRGPGLPVLRLQPVGRFHRRRRRPPWSATTGRKR